MREGQSDSDFYAAIAEGAHIPVAQAPSLVEDFLNAISEFVSDDALEILVDLAPPNLSLSRTRPERDEATVEQFLVTMSGEEAVAAGRAAEHARVVAEALRSRSDPSLLEDLQDAIADDEILALFELTRGEMTTQDRPTAVERTRFGE